MASAKRCLEISPRFRFQYEPSQKGYVLLYPEGMVRLNATAAEILKRCNGTLTEDGLVDELKQRFRGQSIENDVREFLRAAYERGWIRYAESG